MLAISLLHFLVDIPALICEYFYVDKEQLKKTNFHFTLVFDVLSSKKVHNNSPTSICTDEGHFIGH